MWMGLLEGGKKGLCSVMWRTLCGREGGQGMLGGLYLVVVVEEKGFGDERNSFLQ